MTIELHTFSYKATYREKPNASLSLILFASSWQISLEVEAESTGRLMARPSISVRDTTKGFFVLVAYELKEGINHIVKRNVHFDRSISHSPAALTRLEALRAPRS